MTMFVPVSVPLCRKGAVVDVYVAERFRGLGLQGFRFLTGMLYAATSGAPGLFLWATCGAQFKALRFTEVLAVQFCGPALRFEKKWACGSSFRTKGPSTQASYTSPKSFTESTCCHSTKFSSIWYLRP